jgi:hypothetical protein
MAAALAQCVYGNASVLWGSMRVLQLGSTYPLWSRQPQKQQTGTQPVGEARSTSYSRVVRETQGSWRGPQVIGTLPACASGSQVVR